MQTKKNNITNGVQSVAPQTEVSAATKELLGRTDPSNPVGKLQRYDALDSDTLTDVEAFAIRALRDRFRAESDPEYLRDLDAWEEMKAGAELVHDERWTLEQARQTVGNKPAFAYYCMVKHAAELHQWFACGLQGKDSATYETVLSYADFDAWQLIHSETAALLDGRKPLDIDREAQPDLYAICNAIKAFVEKRRARFVADMEKGGKAE